MGAMRQFGAGVGLRTAHHIAINLMSLLWPLSPVLHITRLLGLTMVVCLALVAVHSPRTMVLCEFRPGDRRPRTLSPAASRLDPPSAPSPAPGTARPAGRR
jgi:hypothetical protein